MVMSPATPDSFAVLFRFGATMELGRSERPTMRPLWNYGVDGADSPDRKPRFHPLSSRYKCAMPDGGGLSPPSPKFPRWPHVPTDDCALLQCDGLA